MTSNNKKWIIPGVEDLKGHELYSKIEKHNESGELIHYVEYFNKKPHGESITCFSNGQIKEKCYFQHGARFGRYQTFEEDGTIIEDKIL